MGAIRNFFDTSGPHLPAAAKEWGQRVSDRADAGIVTVRYGTDPSHPRPEDAEVVYWIADNGHVDDPINAEIADLIFKPDIT